MKTKIEQLPQHIIAELEALDPDLKVHAGSLGTWFQYGHISAQYKEKILDWEPDRICDKCGQPVQWNSALFFEEMTLQSFAGFVRDRHFYPTESCEGSPSRVEYFTGESSEYREKALKFIALSRGTWEIMNKYYPSFHSINFPSE